MGSQRVGHDLVTEQVPSTDLPNLGLYQIILCTLLLPKKKKCFGTQEGVCGSGYHHVLRSFLDESSPDEYRGICSQRSFVDESSPDGYRGICSHVRW